MTGRRDVQWKRRNAKRQRTRSDLKTYWIRMAEAIRSGRVTRPEKFAFLDEVAKDMLAGMAAHDRLRVASDKLVRALCNRANLADHSRDG